MINYPAALDGIAQFGQPTGTTLVTAIDHSALHDNLSTFGTVIENVLGTNSGTSVLKNFTAGQFPLRIDTGGTIKDAVFGGTLTTVAFAGGTFNFPFISTPSIVGGSMNSALFNNGTFGTPAITGGTITAGVINNSTLGTPAITGGTITSTVIQTHDGWTGFTDTCVYASATTFTISGVDRTTTFTKGTKLKFTNNSIIVYATVLSSTFSTNTTVTVIANNDYTIANSAITNPFYSYQVNPQGFPAWFNYTPTLTPGGSLTYTSVTNDFARFRPSLNGSIQVEYSSHGTTGGSGANTVTVSLPCSVLVIGQAGRFLLNGITEYAVTIYSGATSYIPSAATSVTLSRSPATSNFDLGTNATFEFVINADL